MAQLHYGNFPNILPSHGPAQFLSTAGSERPACTGTLIVSCGSMYFDSWYELLLLALTLASITLQLYAIALIVSISPAPMATYRYFLCLYTIGFPSVMVGV